MRGAAFSGGGFFGNVTVGMLQRIAEDDDFEPWDCMTGVSTGDLIREIIAMHPKSEFREAVQQATEIYTPRVTSDIHEAWFMGKLAALWKPSIRKTEKLSKLVDDLLDIGAVRNSEYGGGAGIVNLDNGQYELVEPDYPSYVEAVKASSSLPAFFEPVQLPGKGWAVDGGAAVGCDIASLIKMGCTEIDAFVTVPETLKPKALNDPKALDIALRTFEVMVHTLLWQQIKMTRIYNKLVLAGGDEDKKYIKLRVFAPDMVIGDAMEFIPEQAVVLQKIGWDVAEKVLSE